MAKSTGTKYARKAGSGAGKVAERYTHPEQTSPMRPDVGTQAQFRKKKSPKTYRYDSSLSPALDWDGRNGVRELGEWLLALMERAARPGSKVFATPQTLGGDGGPLVTIASLEEAVVSSRWSSSDGTSEAERSGRRRQGAPRRPSCGS